MFNAKFELLKDYCQQKRRIHSPSARFGVDFVSFIAFISLMRANTPFRQSVSRLDPQSLSQLDLSRLRQIKVVLHQSHPALISPSGERIDLPQPLYELLVKIVSDVEQGNVITLLPENQELTTQAAANFLGISRPFLIRLLEDGKIPFRKVGTHRRVAFEHLLKYSQERAATRKTSLNDLTRKVQEAGVYDRTLNEG